MRPGIAPVCGPSSSNGIARENVWPRRTVATPRNTASDVMKLSVPRWSATPHRPQFESRCASSFSAGGRGMRSLGRVLLAELVLEDLAGRVAGQDVNDLERRRDLLGRELGVERQGEDAPQGGRRDAVAWHDDRAGPLPRGVVRQPDHGVVADAWVREEDGLELLGTDGFHLP